MKLAIISHTEHYTLADGTLVGLSSTVNELNNLQAEFETIYHIAMLHHGTAPANTMAYNSKQIIFIPIPKVGGKRFKDKWQIITKAPETIRIITKVLNDADYFQFRAPIGIGVYLIPYLILFIKTKGWFKYAGNWNQNKPPLGYALQRWMLKNQSRKVTINGVWPNQPKQCLSFENPCLTEDDILKGRQFCSQKVWLNKKSFCFVGRLEPEKGVPLIIETFKLLSEEEKTHIDTLHFIGDGRHYNRFKNEVKDLGITVLFHGILSRKDVFDVYKQSHVLLLPSKSEGFPKVIIESMNFGCIPIVSNVSSIGHYISYGVHGYLMESLTPSALLKQLQIVLQLHSDDYLRIVKNQESIIRKFTYSNYHRHLKDKVL